MYYVSFFKKGDTIQGGTLFKGEHYLRKNDRYEVGIIFVQYNYVYSWIWYAKNID